MAVHFLPPPMNISEDWADKWAACNQLVTVAARSIGL